MKPELQTKLLRVLQDKRVDRLNDTNPRPVDVRILCATNQDLERAVAEARFREDLFYGSTSCTCASRRCASAARRFRCSRSSSSRPTPAPTSCGACASRPRRSGPWSPTTGRATCAS